MRFNRKCLYSMNILAEIRTNILIYHNLSVKSALKYIVFCHFWYFYWVFLNTKLHLNKLLNSFHFADITHINCRFQIPARKTKQAISITYYIKFIY